jgi:hypothetical protein
MFDQDNRFFLGCIVIAVVGWLAFIAIIGHFSSRQESNELPNDEKIELLYDILDACQNQNEYTKNQF